MKKTIILALVAIATIFAFSSCQKENLESNCPMSGVRIITGTFENPATKTTLNSDGKTPEWEVGDVIRILNGTSYQDVTLESGAATPTTEGKGIIKDGAIEIAIPSTMTGTLYSVYPASATAMTNCSGGSIIFTIPAVQDGTFSSANICVAKGDDKDNLIFRNATAVLKIRTAADVVGVDITAANNIAGSVTASFSGNDISLTPALVEKSVFVVRKSAPSGNVFYLAAAPGATGSTIATCYKIDKSGSTSKDSKDLQKNVIYSMDLSSVEINTDCDLTGKKDVLNGHEFVIIKAKYDGTNDSYLKWATMNIGATTLTGTTSYGDLFSWGEVATKANYGQTYYVDPAKSISKNIAPDSGYDAARVNWGGTWRMPTGNDREFIALKNATYWNWDYTDYGYYVYVPQSGDAGKVNNGTGSYIKSDALLFFPAAGYSNSNSRSNECTFGGYWSSTWQSVNGAYRLRIEDNGNVYPQAAESRYYGHSVRPVSD